MQLRDYQSAAVDACWDHIRNREDNPCIVIPTGGGKSLVLAKLAHDVATTWGGRVIILAHVKELLEQNRDKLQAISPDLKIGVYSAGLNRRDKKHNVIIAGVQSVYQHACDFDPFDIAIIDEAHLITTEGDGMYRRFLSDCTIVNPNLRLIGLTATPYRMSTGWICEKSNLLNNVCYEIGVKQMILDGWLSKLISKEPIRVDTSSLHIRGGEFIQEEATALMNGVVGPACNEIIERTAQRKSVLIFCQSIDHAVQVKITIKKSGRENVELITGETPDKDRSEILDNFKNKKIKYLVNVNVLTTGFDAPNVDCVCLLRPTMSPGLYYQMVGRGFRLSEGKENCLVLDFGGNVRRHGPVDQVEPKPRKANGDSIGDLPVKPCPECESIVHAGYSECPECGYKFPDKEMASHDGTPGNAPVTSLETVRTEYQVRDTRYFVHKKYKAGPDDPKTMRVEYKVDGLNWVSEWICIEHSGFVRGKAMSWWKARSNDPFPKSAQNAVDIANAGGLATTESIVVEEKSGEKFPRIKLAKIGRKPEKIDINPDDDFDFTSIGKEPEEIRDFTEDEFQTALDIPF